MNPRYFIDTIYLSNVKKKTKPCKKEIIKQIKKYNKPEIDICEKIKKIPYYFCFFSPILEYNLLDRVDSYIIVSREKLIPFHDFFKKINKNEKIVHILSSYRHLVEGIQKLNTIGILYGNYESIGFNYQNQPIMFNFERNQTKIQYLPIEVHIISFLTKNNNKSLSISNIREICDNFLSKTPSYEPNEVKKCVNIFSYLVNKPSNDIIEDMKIRMNTWDLYGIAMLYFSLLETIPDRENILFFEEILKKSLSIDPSMRMSIDDVISSMNMFSLEFTS